MKSKIQLIQLSNDLKTEQKKFRVVNLTNTIQFSIGQELQELTVKDLINIANIDVNIRQAKDSDFK